MRVYPSPAERFERAWLPEPNSGCWLWVWSMRGKYGQFFLETDSGEERLAHRASWRLHRGKIPDGMMVCHRCDTRLCVNPDHLFLGTARDNMRDAARKGRMAWKKGQVRRLPRGELHHQARLSTADVVAIRSSPKSGVELARDYGVTAVTVSRVRRRLIWAHVA